MAIVLRYKTLRDPNFLQGIDKLATHTSFPTKTCIIVAKLKKTLDEEGEIAQKAFANLLKQHAVLDEKGDFVPHEGRPGTYQIPDEKKADWIKAVEDFGEQEVVIEKSKIPYADLEGVRISPMELLAIDEILCEPQIAAVPNKAA